MQSYDFERADIGVAISGSQNVSFKLDSGDLQQRIDRHFTPAGTSPVQPSPASTNQITDYWSWGSPKLDPFDFSLVVRGGDDGFACYVKGNNQIWLPTDLASGYTDGEFDSFLFLKLANSLQAPLAEYLVLQGEMLSPHLLLKVGAPWFKCLSMLILV